jgi:hypothetical protein
MIKLKNILIKEEMSSSDKRDMKSSTRNIDFHVGYIEKEIKKLVKILNKEGLRKSSRELELSFKNRILEFQKDVKNISAQHLQEAFPPSSLGSSTYSNKEAMKFSIDSVNKAGKIIGQAQKKVMDIFTSDMKNKKYDRIDLSRSIHKGNIRDTSFSKREVLKTLFYDLKDRFNQYGRRKK